MNKRGFEISFGFIFSVILIGAIIFTGFYAIGKFLDVRKCAEAGIFYNDLQEAIDRAWNSEITKNTLRLSVPSGVEKVCFGDISAPSNIPEYSDLRTYGELDSNIFFYPYRKSCAELGNRKIEHVGFDFSGVKCFETASGRIEIKIEKESTDGLVRVLE